MQVKVKYKKIFYTYHPDFIQDDIDPRGYQLLSTGRWIVEWDVVASYVVLPQGREHRSKSFTTEQEAIAFDRALRNRIDDDGVVLIDDSEL